MKAFASLLDALSFEARRNRKIALIAAYLKTAPDPDRGYALAALCGALSFHAAKPAMLKTLIATRVDETLFALSYDFVGDLSETIALLWPVMVQNPEPPRLATVIATLQSGQKRDLPQSLALWLDALDETGRWALLKLITGGLRVGVSAALAKQALALYSGQPVEAIEEVWHGVEPPYAALFAWLDGRTGPPDASAALTFRSPMLAHPLEEAEFDALNPADFSAEWKWDGIRIEAARRGDSARLFSRTGDDISKSFPDLAAALAFDGVMDGELVVMHAGAIGSFSDLQQRLNRKSVSQNVTETYPAHLVAYDLLFEGGEDLRGLPFTERRARLEALLARHASPRLSLSPLIAFKNWEELAAKRAESAQNPAIEGVMLKRRDSPYLAGRPRGHWYKWKRAARLVDCVMMYAQRGHGKRSSFYSDFTFGVWAGEKLVPVGKAYSGFTDAELLMLDRFVRANTTNRFGPVREVAQDGEKGLVLEIAFEGLQASTRHKSGIAMRFPRINRIRQDKPAREADRIETLKALLAGEKRAEPSASDAR